MAMGDLKGSGETVGREPTSLKRHPLQLTPSTASSSPRRLLTYHKAALVVRVHACPSNKIKPTLILPHLFQLNLVEREHKYRSFRDPRKPTLTQAIAYHND
jgi:hypothetical protein